MSRPNYLFTSESVSEGHPDKVCDRVSDAILDAFLREDPYARVACETFATTDRVVVGGEVRGPQKVIDSVEQIVRDCIKDIGYTQRGFHWETLNVHNYLHEQSADIAQGVDAAGNKVTLTADEMGMSYRHSEAPADLIYTHGLFQGRAGTREDLLAEIDAITEQRAGSQPIKERTGGSTFANPDPPGTPDQRKSWQLIDKAGCRGLKVGDAMMSQMHCNFLINCGNATALDIETLGETVRRRVKESSGVDLRWEIRRIGEPAAGQELPG